MIFWQKHNLREKKKYVCSFYFFPLQFSTMIGCIVIWRLLFFSVGCGSCYAFGSLAMNEARIRIMTNGTMTPVLSTQDIVECSEYSQGLYKCTIKFFSTNK